MAIVNELDRNEFSNMFDQYGRGDNFTHTARLALFDYYDELSNDTGEPFKVDIIGLCCEWSEYEQDELINHFGYMIDLAVYDDQEDQISAISEELQDQTTLIELDNGCHLVGDF